MFSSLVVLVNVFSCFNADKDAIKIKERRKDCIKPFKTARKKAWLLFSDGTPAGRSVQGPRRLEAPIRLVQPPRRVQGGPHTVEGATCLGEACS